MELAKRVVARYLEALTKKDLPPAFREKWGRFVRDINHSGQLFSVTLAAPPKVLEDRFGKIPGRSALKQEFSQYFTFSSKVPGGISGKLKDVRAQTQGGGLFITVEWQERWGA